MVFPSSETAAKKKGVEGDRKEEEKISSECLPFFFSVMLSPGKHSMYVCQKRGIFPSSSSSSG